MAVVSWPPMVPITGYISPVPDATLPPKLVSEVQNVDAEPVHPTRRDTDESKDAKLLPDIVTISVPLVAPDVFLNEVILGDWYENSCGDGNEFPDRKTETVSPAPTPGGVTHRIVLSDTIKTCKQSVAPIRTKSGSNPMAPKLEPDIKMVALPDAGEYGGVMDSN